MKPSLELHVEVETETGRTFRWDGNGPAQDRPQSLQFKTRIGDGFAESSCVLRRNEQIVYPDLGKLATHRYIGADGSIAYEGRGVRFPTGQRQITAEAVGWMSHAKDRQITFLGIDQDLSQWVDASSARKAANDAANLQSASAQVQRGGSTSDATLLAEITGPWEAAPRPMIEPWYDAGPGNLIGSIWYAWQVTGEAGFADANWVTAVLLSDDDVATTVQNTGDLQPAGDTGSGTLTASGVGKRFAFAQFYYATGPAGSDGVKYGVAWRFAVYGDHGIPLVGTPAPYGLLASDIIKHLAGQYTPLLDASQVTPTAEVLEQVVFRDLITPYDAWRKLNAYERRNLAVWENRKLYYEPIDDSAADWVIRQDEGATVQIDDPGGLGRYNGAAVRFQNIATLRSDIVTPDTNPELADTDPEIPANKYGITNWVPAQLPDPNSTAGAIKIGQALLEESNRSREPGTATIQGHIRDAAGNWHQGWKVRAGDTVSVADYPDDRPRVIHETTWDDDSKTLTMTLDAAEQTPEATLDQIIGNPRRPT